jgi:signal peptidase I
MRTTYRVPSYAMHPTLDLGQRVSVDHEAYTGREPELGDIVVFHPPFDTEPDGESLCSQPRPGPSPDTYIKRVVAGPGDALTLRNGRVVLNGSIETRDSIDYSEGWPYCHFEEEIVVPPGTWYVLGDNRGQSDDSRYFGPIPPGWILGKVVGISTEEAPALD